MTQLKPFDDLYAVPPGQVPEGYKELFTTESATEQDWAAFCCGDFNVCLPKPAPKPSKRTNAEDLHFRPVAENRLLSVRAGQ